MTIIRTVSVISVALAFFSRPAAANPVGGTVVGGNGNATISGQGTATTTINQSANRVIINWQNFSIGAGEVTKFVQPSANAVALNRVFSANPSQIYGSLQANGRVFVINPNGIMVGAHGQIDTKGFLASTIDLPNSSFLSGSKNLTFSGNSSAAIRNEGTIQALGGDVYLIAHTVENSGTIRAQQGTVGLAAGSQVRLVQSGNERLSVIAGGSAGSAKGLDNSGNIEAASAELKAAGGNIYALAINNGGVVRANGFARENGRIVLKASGGNIGNSGTLVANNANGSGGSVTLDGGHSAASPSIVMNSGTIQAMGGVAGAKGGSATILGDQISLSGTALIDVSGRNGGGVALVGGDAHGSNPNVQNAQQTTVALGARINADAIENGDGGKVVVWADRNTIFDGMISGKALGASGNGGFAEISGKQNLTISGHAYLGSAHGVRGSLLLDPGSVTIDHGADVDSRPNVIHDAWIVDQLTPPGGADLTISTADGNNGGTEDLIVNGTAALGGAADITWNTGNSLTLIGNNSVTLQAGSNIKNSGSGNLIIQSGGNVDLNGTINMNDAAAELNITAGGHILEGASGVINANALATFAAGSSSDITLNSTANDFTTVRVTSGQNASVVDGNAIIVGSSTVSGSFNVSTPDTIAFAANATITAGSVSTHSGTDGGGGTSFGNTVLIKADTQSYQAGDGPGGSGGAVNLTGNTPSFRNTAGSAKPNSFTYKQDNDIADGNIPAASQFGGAPPGTPPTTYIIQSDDGNLTLTTPQKVAGSALTLSANGILTLGGGTAAELWNLSSLVANSSGNIVFDGDVTATSVSAHSGTDGAGDIIFNSLPSAAVVDIHADTQSYQAGNAAGPGNNAVANLVGNTPGFRNSAGSATPTTFTYRQDENIADANIPSASQFGGTAPGTYAIQSDNGTLTLSTASKVAGSALTLSAAQALTIGAALNLVSLNAVGTTIALNAAGTALVPSVQTSAGQTYTGPITLGAATVLKDTVGNSIALGSVDGNQSLQVITSGNVALGTIGFSAPLAGVTVQANMLTLNGNLSTRNGTVDFTGVSAVSLGNSVTIDTDDTQDATAAGSINFGAATTIDGNAAGRTLTLNASGQGSDGSGNISLGIVGVTTRLAGLTAKANAVTLNGNISTEDGAVDFTGVSAVTLANNVKIDTDSTQNGGSAGVINFGALTTINGNKTLTLDASGEGTDGSGNVALGIVGGSTRITALTIKANTLTLNGNISTENGLVDLTAVGAVTLANNVAIDTDGTQDAVTAGAINFGSATTINGNKNLILDASGEGTDSSGNVALGIVGGSTRIGNLTIKADTLTLNGNISTEDGAVDFSTVAAVNLINSVTISTDGTQDGGAAGAITFGSATTINGTGSSLPGQVLVLDAQGQGTDGSGNINIGVVGTTSSLLGGLTAKGGNVTLNGDVKIYDVDPVILESTGDIAIGVNITAGEVDVRSGTDGTGNITFGPGITIKADFQSYRAGDGPGGGGNTAKADLLGNNPSFLSNLGVIESFTLRQDAAIASSDIPLTSPVSYTIQSDEGSVTLPALTLPGTLQVFANGPITQVGPLIVPTSTFGAGAANNILLNDPANNFGTISISSGNDVTLNDVNAIILGGPSIISGNLSVTAGGNITESGVLTVNGTGKAANFTVTAPGSDISLETQANDFTAVNVAGPVHNLGIRNISGAAAVPLLPSSLNDLTLIFNNAPITLPALNLSGKLDVSAKGITDGGNILVGGTTTLASLAGNDILLNHADDFVGPVTVTSGNNVTLNDVNALTLGAMTISGNLKATAVGPITETGALIVNGVGKNATFDAGAANNITLDTQNNDFRSVIITSGNDVAIKDANGIDLGASTISGNLSVKTTGAITESGALTVAGASKTATFDAGTASNITLGTQGNDFTSVKVTSGNDVAIKDINGIDLGASTISGNLSVKAAGAITESGVLTVAGASKTATFDAGTANNITLDTQNNDFTSVIITSGNDVAIKDANGIDLGASTISGNLSVKATGAITESGALTVAGASKTATFDAGTANNITLDTQNNDFRSVIITSGNDVAIKDANGIDLGASTISGNLSVKTAGAITESGVLTVNGASKTATFDAGTANNITLDTQNNDFRSVIITSGNDVAIKDANGIDLGASTISGNLSVKTAGAITESGVLTVNGASKTATFDAGTANNIALDTQNNDFRSVIITSGNDVAIKDANGIDLGASTISGNLSVKAAGAITESGALTVAGASKTATFDAGTANNITLDTQNNDFRSVIITSGNDVAIKDANGIDLGASTISGNLSVKTTGAITESGALTVAGASKTATFDAGTGNNITLDTQGNDFTSVKVTSGNDVAIKDINGIDLGASTISGNLSVKAAGAITESGVLTVAGASKTATFDAGTANNITLDTQNNDFTSVIITSGNDVAIKDANGIDLGASTISGNLSVKATGAITESGALTVAGASKTATFDAGTANNITLDTQNNDFRSVIITSGNDVAIKDANGIDLGASTISGNLSVKTTGAITESGVLTVNGASKTATFDAGTANNITLDTQNNDFTSVIITSGNDVAIKDANGIDLGASTISGNLSVKATGAITENGVLTVNGASKTATFDAGTANNIALDTQNNDFRSVIITSGNDVAIKDANGIDLGASTISGNLSVKAAGAITESGALTVAGASKTATFDAGTANNITLDTQNNDFRSVIITSGNDVAIKDANGIDLGASTISGNLSVKTTGAITESGALTVAGASKTATFDAGTGNNITLDTQGNDFTSVKVTSGNDVAIKDINGIDLGASTISGNLSVKAAGAITESGVLTVAGASKTATFDAGTANNITLDTQNNDFTSVIITSGNDVAIKDANGIDLGASTISGNLSVKATGAITESGALTVAGASKTATFDAGTANNITLDTQNNDFTSVIITSGKDVSLKDVNGIDLGASTIVGALAVTAGGNITDSGNLSVAVASTFKTSDGSSITLDQNGNTFNGPVTFTASSGTLKDVTIVDTTDFDIQAVTVDPLVGTLSVTSGGQITQSGGINAHELVVSAGGSIKLGADLDPGHTLSASWPFDNHVGMLSATITVSGKDFTFKDLDPLIVNGIQTVNGNVTLAADSMDIQGPINYSSIATPTGRTTLLPVTPGRQITLGSEVPGTLSLTGLELNQITAGTLQIGDEHSGDMNIVDLVSFNPANVSILSIRSGGSILESGPGAIRVPNICIETVASAPGKTVSLLGANDFSLVAADGHPIHVNDINDFQTRNPDPDPSIPEALRGVDDCQSHPSQDRGHNSFVPIGSELIRFQGADKTIATAAALAGLSSVIIPVPKLDTSTFSGAAVSTEDASQILPAQSIGTLWLLLPFPPPEERKYKIEDQSKWTSGRIAAVGSTAGPQSAR